MKKLSSSAALLFLSALGGLVTLLLRLWLLSLGVDNRGLLAAGSLPDTMSWIAVALTLALLGLGTWKLPNEAKGCAHFPASAGAAIGIAMAAAGITITSLRELSLSFDTIGMLSSVLGLITAVSLGFLAFFRAKGWRPNILFHGIVCIYFMFHLVFHYRLWSSCPQLQDYGFELLAIVFVMIACYQRAAFDAGRGTIRSYAFFSAAALFFCIAALPGCDNSAFFIGCAVWMAATPCKILPSEKQQED